MPARPRKPRDKAKVEAAVLIVQRWILARLRNRRFFSLAELNVAIRILVDDLNARLMRKLGASRREFFDTIDRPALMPLPAEPYQYAEWRRARVAPDYHVEVQIGLIAAVALVKRETITYPAWPRQPDRKTCSVLLRLETASCLADVGAASELQVSPLITLRRLHL